MPPWRVGIRRRREVDLMGNTISCFDVAFAIPENAHAATFSSKWGVPLLAATQRPAGGELRPEQGPVGSAMGVSRPKSAQNEYVFVSKAMVVGDARTITLGTGSTVFAGTG
jgi:hypothetical protein